MGNIPSASVAPVPVPVPVQSNRKNYKKFNEWTAKHVENTINRYILL